MDESVTSIIARAQGMGTQFQDQGKRRTLLDRSARGESIGAAAFSQPGARSDLAAVATRADRDGDEYVTTGRKRWTGNAKAADFIQLLCRERDPGPDERRSAGMATFISEKERDAFRAGLSGTPMTRSAITVS